MVKVHIHSHGNSAVCSPTIKWEGSFWRHLATHFRPIHPLHSSSPHPPHTGQDFPWPTRRSPTVKKPVPVQNRQSKTPSPSHSSHIPPQLSISSRSHSSLLAIKLHRNSKLRRTTLGSVALLRFFGGAMDKILSSSSSSSSSGCSWRIMSSWLIDSAKPLEWSVFEQLLSWREFVWCLQVKKFVDERPIQTVLQDLTPSKIVNEKRMIKKIVCNEYCIMVSWLKIDSQCWLKLIHNANWFHHQWEMQAMTKTKRWSENQKQMVVDFLTWFWCSQIQKMFCVHDMSYNTIARAACWRQYWFDYRKSCTIKYKNTNHFYRCKTWVRKILNLSSPKIDQLDLGQGVCTKIPLDYQNKCCSCNLMNGKTILNGQRSHWTSAKIGSMPKEIKYVYMELINYLSDHPCYANNQKSRI